MVMDYGKACRIDFGPSELKDARERRDYYFCDAQKNPRSFYHPWFDPLEEILFGLGFGWSYFNATAIHFDLVACTTEHPWRFVPGPAQKALQQNCGQFFQQTLSELPQGTILLSNGVEPKDIPVVKKDVVGEFLKASQRLIVWRGSLSHDKRSFAFLGWRPSLNSLSSVGKETLLRWLRGQIPENSRRPPWTAGLECSS